MVPSRSLLSHLVNSGFKARKEPSTPFGEPLVTSTQAALPVSNGCPKGVPCPLVARSESGAARRGVSATNPVSRFLRLVGFCKGNPLQKSIETSFTHFY